MSYLLTYLLSSYSLKKVNSRLAQPYELFGLFIFLLCGKSLGHGAGCSIVVDMLTWHQSVVNNVEYNAKDKVKVVLICLVIVLCVIFLYHTIRRSLHWLRGVEKLSNSILSLFQDIHDPSPCIHQLLPSQHVPLKCCLWVGCGLVYCTFVGP